MGFPPFAGSRIMIYWNTTVKKAIYKGVFPMRDKNNQRKPADAEADGLIEGRNAVIEALRAGTAIDKI